MRYSRMLPGHPKKRRRGTNLIVVAVILGITAYFIGAGAAGGWLAEHVINPVFNSGTGAAGSPAPTAETTPATQESAPSSSPTAQPEEQITARSIALYTLQAGAFSSKQNAEAAAGEISVRGGAGFVAYDGDLYRALIAGYTRESDANSVRTELATQGIDSTVFVLESGALEFKIIGAGQAQRDAVKACFTIVPDTVDALQQIIYDADKGENVDARLAALKKDADEVTAKLRNAISSDADAMVRLCTYMEGFCATLGGIPASADVSDVAFSSGLKYNIISIVVDYSSFLNDISTQ